MPLARHTAPILPGEDILEMPKAEDPRVEPWLKHLQELGVIDGNGRIAIAGAVLRRGVFGGNYVWEIEWKEPVKV